MNIFLICLWLATHSTFAGTVDLFHVVGYTHLPSHFTDSERDFALGYFLVNSCFSGFRAACVGGSILDSTSCPCVVV